jgi:hypothetical protein
MLKMLGAKELNRQQVQKDDSNKKRKVSSEVEHSVQVPVPDIPYRRKEAETNDEFHSRLSTLLFPKNSYLNDINALMPLGVNFDLEQALEKKFKGTHVASFYLHEKNKKCERHIVLCFYNKAVVLEGEWWCKFGACIWNNIIDINKPQEKIESWDKSKHRSTAMQRFQKNPIYIKLNKDQISSAMDKLLYNKTERIGNDLVLVPMDILGSYLRAKGVRYGVSSRGWSLAGRFINN